MLHRAGFALNFNRKGLQRAGALAQAAAVLLAVGCSGPSTYNTSANPPVAVAHVVGELATSAKGADPVTVTVRSQGQVTLTGNASDGGAAAIANFSWAQTDGAGTPTVKLLYTDSDTVTFTAPAVGQDTSLHFTLTVTTAGNTSATAHVIVLVKSAVDANQLLSQPKTVLSSYKVAVTTVEGLGALASPSESLSSDVPICVTENRSLVYVARDGNQHAVSLAPIQTDTTWAAAIGGAANEFGSYSNPRVTFAIPARNEDDLAYLYNNPVPGESSSAAAARLALQLVPSDMDSFTVSITAAVSAGPCAAASTGGVAGKTLAVQILDQNGNPVGAATTATSQGAAVTSAAFTPDMLVSQTAAPTVGLPTPTAQYETLDTARAYYDAIDPTGAKTTLTAWLNANCFNAAAANFGADAHGVYTNNFDLGFGRDMYFVTCKTGPHTGDMASVVINYPSVEAAAGKVGAFIAVAMEYSAATDAGTAAGQTRNQRRFPKFYVFAPDDRTGEFRRISSANFDHRGQKYVPGACAACHAGTPPQFPANFSHPVQSTATAFATVPDPTATPAGGVTPQLGLADIDAVFMPWDLDSFLYADTDPTYLGFSVSPTGYTRAAQEPNLKILNQLSYCTYQPALEPQTDGTTIDRFASSRRLIAQWYGGAIAPDGSTAVDPGCAQTGIPTASLLPGSFSDTYTPAGWTKQTAPGGNSTSQTSDTVYHMVFARYCRSCHTQNSIPKNQFSSYASFINAFQVTPASPGVSSAAGLGVQYVFKQGKMPLARLTMDRFWVNYSSGDNAAKILAQHIQEVNAETDLVNPMTSEAIPSGQPTIFVNANGPNAGNNVFTPYTSTSAVINRFGGVSVDASSSFFVGNYSWSLCVIAPGSSNCAATPLVGSGVATPGFSNYAPGEYDLQLIADNGIGASVPTTFKLTVPQHKPALDIHTPPQPGDCATSLSNSTIAAPNVFGPVASVDLSTCIIGGDEPTLVPNTFQLLDPVTGMWGSAVSEASLSWNASATSSCNPATQKCSYGISSAFNNMATGDPGTGIVTGLSYRVTDVDGDSVTGLLNLLLTDTLTAGGGSQTFFAPPASTYAIPVASLSNVVVPASDINVTLVVPANFSSLPASVAPPPTGTVQFPKGGSVPSTPQSALSGQFITYTPPSPTFLTCDVNGNDVQSGNPPCVGDSFWYYLVSGTGTATSPTLAEVFVKIQASTSFFRTNTASDVYKILDTNCSSCHETGITPTSSSEAYYHWAVTVGNATTTYNSITGTDTTNNVAGINWTNHTPTGGSTFGDATLAALYYNPCNPSSTHSMNDFNLSSGSPASCQKILQWIKEGAYND
jgi:mono/diheme cytochrome c family protein